jgi:branched-chain amino acid aminotransferase
MQVWLNGEFVDRNEAKISAFDAGVQHAVGLFETMHARGGKVFRVEAHMHRLVESARELRLTERMRPDPLCDAVEATAKQSGLAESRVRLTLTGGDLNYLQAKGKSAQDPTILIVAQPATEYPAQFFTEGVTVVLADGRLNPLDPLGGHKTLSYWGRIMELQRAATFGAGEALWFTVSNHLACGSVSNVWAVKHDHLFTPIARGEEAAGALRSPVLPGITRGVIGQLAEEMKIEVHKRVMDINDVLEADEVFLTNSSWGVLPVTRVEKEQVGTGAVGPLTSQLRDAWLRRVAEETGDSGTEG